MRQYDPADVAANNGELLLRLTDIDHLFHAPDITPLSQSPAEVLGISGVDHLLNLLQMDKRLQRARKLAIILPAGNGAVPDTEPVELALHRYAGFRIERERRELRSTYV